jgi:hypothetical protein
LVFHLLNKSTGTLFMQFIQFSKIKCIDDGHTLYINFVSFCEIEITRDDYNSLVQSESFREIVQLTLNSATGHGGDCSQR